MMFFFAYGNFDEAEARDDFVLEVGYFEFPGLTHTDENGKAAGLVNDITVKTLDHAGIRYRIRSYPAARFFNSFAEGDIHFFNGLSSIPIVQASAISSEIPLFPLVMNVYWVGDKPPIAKKEDLVGKSVILINGFTYKDWGAWIRDGSNNVTFYDTYTHLSSFKMLARGRADYLLNYRFIDDDVLAQYPIPDIRSKKLFEWQCYFNIQKDTPNAEALLKRIEGSYNELKASGKLRDYDL